MIHLYELLLMDLLGWILQLVIPVEYFGILLWSNLDCFQILMLYSWNLSSKSAENIICIVELLKLL